MIDRAYEAFVNNIINELNKPENIYSEFIRHYENLEKETRRNRINAELDIIRRQSKNNE